MLLSFLKIVVDSGSAVELPVCCFRARRIDFRCMRSVRANRNNWEVAGYHLAANKSYGIRSVHKLAYSPTPVPAFSAVSKALSSTGIAFGTSLTPETFNSLKNTGYSTDVRIAQ